MAFSSAAPGAPARIAATTISNFLRKEEINLYRRSKFLAWVRAANRVKYNQAGTQLEWTVRLKRAQPTYGHYGETYTFQPQNRWRTAVLPWRAMRVTDTHSKMDRLVNRTPEAILKFTAQTFELLKEDIEEQFRYELYVDGTTAANSQRIHGLDSVTGYSGITGNKFYTNSATYAGLSCVLGSFGGTWTGTWPDGVSTTPEYDGWTALGMQYTGSGWAATTDTWQNNSRECLRTGVMYMQRNGGGGPSIVMLEQSLYRGWLATLDDKERIVVTSSRDGKMSKFGFGDMSYFEGAEITWEFGVPANKGYGLTERAVSLVSMQDQLFKTEQEIDLASGVSQNFLVDFFGNLILNPREMFWVNSAS